MIRHWFNVFLNMLFMKDWNMHGQTIGQPEWHNNVLVVPTGGGKSSILFIPFSDAEKVVNRVQI